MNPLRRLLRKPKLFDGEAGLFTDAARNCRVYGEYGCGLSTRWMLDNTDATVLSVDTSPEWVASIPAHPRLDLRAVDVGPLGDWGKPLGFTKRDGFPIYIDSLWTRAANPDLVLIDGRFRVACFLATLLNAKPGTVVIFDDYVPRPFYHVVEELVVRDGGNSRQARFIVPADFDRAAAQELRSAFALVLD